MFYFCIHTYVYIYIYIYIEMSHVYIELKEKKMKMSLIECEAFVCFSCYDIWYLLAPLFTLWIFTFIKPVTWNIFVVGKYIFMYNIFYLPKSIFSNNIFIVKWFLKKNHFIFRYIVMYVCMHVSICLHRRTVMQTLLPLYTRI